MTNFSQYPSYSSGDTKDEVQKPKALFEHSAIVVAHPDDEVLWFSSILEKVDKIVFCYLGVRSNAKWSNGRRKSLSEYPRTNISCLNIETSEVFECAEWAKPVITQYGMEISNKGVLEKQYRDNYSNLKARLETKLKGCSNVFTHNPWGDYGHEEHVQVYRVVKELQKKMSFTLWYSNYCSNKSFNLMLRYISGFDSEYITLKSNKMLADNIRNLYKKNGCWTWFNDWEWFNEESFKEDEALEGKDQKHGHIFPINFVKLDLEAEPSKAVRVVRQFVNRISRKWY